MNSYSRSMNAFRVVAWVVAVASLLGGRSAFVPVIGYAAPIKPPHAQSKTGPALSGDHPQAPHAGRQVKRATPAQRKSAMKSITSQLDAFRRNDYETAATYQSAGLKGNFPSIDAFRKMMQSAYPEFTNYRSVDFGPAFVDPTGKHLLIQVKLIGADALTVEAAYLMILEDKVFRVEGVLGGHTAPVPTTNA